MFEGKASSRYADRMPRVVDAGEGRPGWAFDGAVHCQYGIENAAGRPPSEWEQEPLRYADMPRGYWDVEARVAAMDTDNVWASICFPSMWCGFAGRIFQTCSDPELGLEAVLAYNRWHLEGWAGRYPDRFIPMQLTWLADPEISAAQIRANCALGFKAVSFPDQPQRLGFPGVVDPYWDPLFRACEETDTVVCLHCGGGGWTLGTDIVPGSSLVDADLLFKAAPTLFQGTALVTATDWIWSGIPVRYPQLKISMSEGGIGWVAMLRDRLEYQSSRSASLGRDPYAGSEFTPSEALARSFWFCTIDDPSAIPVRHRIGVDHIMVETDYPHTDSPWPHTQAALNDMFRDVPTEETDLMTHQNAASLFRHPLPVTSAGPTSDVGEHR